MDAHIRKAAVLIEALPYLQEFRRAIFLIKLGGSAMEVPELVANLLRDIVFLEAVGINPVVVHGGGKAISASMMAAGLEAKFIGGLRVTDAASIAIVEETLTREINPRLVSGLRNSGGKAVGLAGTDLFLAKRIGAREPQTGAPVDLGFVGEVVDVELAKLEEAIESECVPVITPLAREDSTGQTLNVNADLAASALGARLKAAKIVYLSDVRGVMTDPGDPRTLIPTLDRSSVNRYVGEGVISGGMIPKVRSALEAIDAGVGKVHLIDGRIPHSLLLEIFTRDGVGTEIVAEAPILS